MNGLSPVEQLSVTLTTVSSFQDTIRHADTKATILLTLQGSLAASIVANWNPDASPPVMICAAMFVCFAAVSCVRFAIALRPRTDGLSVANRFGFVSVSAYPATCDGMDARRLQQDAWQLAVLLAEIAKVKHRHVLAGMPWLGASAIAALTVVSKWPDLLQ